MGDLSPSIEVGFESLELGTGTGQSAATEQQAERGSFRLHSFHDSLGGADRVTRLLAAPAADSALHRSGGLVVVL